MNFLVLLFCLVTQETSVKHYVYYCTLFTKEMKRKGIDSKLVTFSGFLPRKNIALMRNSGDIIMATRYTKS